MNEAQFRQQLKEQGYSEAESLEYKPKGTSKNSPFSGVVDLESG